MEAFVADLAMVARGDHGSAVVAGPAPVATVGATAPALAA
jgi:hypothetical protein